MNTARREESRSDIFCRIGDRHTHACRDLLQRLAQRLRAHRQLSIQRENACAHDGTGYLCLPCCVAAQIR